MEQISLWNLGKSNFIEYWRQQCRKFDRLEVGELLGKVIKSSFLRYDELVKAELMVCDWCKLVLLDSEAIPLDSGQSRFRFVMFAGPLSRPYFIPMKSQ